MTAGLTNYICLVFNPWQAGLGYPSRRQNGEARQVSLGHLICWRDRARLAWEVESVCAVQLGTVTSGSDWPCVDHMSPLSDSSDLPKQEIRSVWHDWFWLCPGSPQWMLLSFLDIHCPTPTTGSTHFWVEIMAPRLWNYECSLFVPKLSDTIMFVWFLKDQWIMVGQWPLQVFYNIL